MTISKTVALAVTAVFLSGAAMAQTPATPPAPAAKTAAPATAPATTEKKAEKPRTAASLACSKDADGKGLHGKDRKKFMSDCKKNAPKT